MLLHPPPCSVPKEPRVRWSYGGARRIIYYYSRMLGEPAASGMPPLILIINQCGSITNAACCRQRAPTGALHRQQSPSSSSSGTRSFDLEYNIIQMRNAAIGGTQAAEAACAPPMSPLSADV